MPTKEEREAQKLAEAQAEAQAAMASRPDAPPAADASTVNADAPATPGQKVVVGPTGTLTATVE